MKKLLLLILMVSCSGCALLNANPGNKYSYPYGNNSHPCVYPCEQDKNGHIIYRTQPADKD